MITSSLSAGPVGRLFQNVATATVVGVLGLEIYSLRKNFENLQMFLDHYKRLAEGNITHVKFSGSSAKPEERFVCGLKHSEPKEMPFQ